MEDNGSRIRAARRFAIDFRFQPISKTFVFGQRRPTHARRAGHSPQIDLRHVFFRQIQILGSTMGSKGSLFGILDLVKAGRLKPIVDRVMPLWNARDAHRALESRDVFGKIVLEVD